MGTKSGDAFLAQPQEVMDSVQRLRKLAQQTGSLKSSVEQKIITTTKKAVPTNQTATAPSHNPIPFLHPAPSLQSQHKPLFRLNPPTQMSFTFRTTTQLLFTVAGAIPPIRQFTFRHLRGTVCRQFRARIRLQHGRRHDIRVIQQHRLG